MIAPVSESAGRDSKVPKLSVEQKLLRLYADFQFLAKEAASRYRAERQTLEQDRPVSYGRGPTYVPRWGMVNTRPSLRSSSIARLAVSRLTPYSCWIVFSLGRGSSRASSPDSIRARRPAATCA